MFDLRNACTHNEFKAIHVYQMRTQLFSDGEKKTYLHNKAVNKIADNCRQQTSK